MIVHIVLDEKFTDAAIRQFEQAVPNNNCWIILGKPRQLSHVNSKNILFLTLSMIIRLVRSDQCEGVVFHSMDEAFIPILKKIPVNKNAIWIGWGFDYYGRLIKKLHPNGLLLEKTKNLMHKKPFYLKIMPRLKTGAKVVLGRHLINSKSILDRVDYFSPVLDIEYDIVKQENPEFDAKYICWNYGSVEDDLYSDAAARSGGVNILLGNSATPENNHIEVLTALADCYEIGSRKIVVPLSYGDPWYAEKVVKFGERLFGGQFHPLVEFIERKKYFDILGECGHSFMNHLRQQALGNIASLLFNGSAVHMNPASPLYHWLIKREICVFSIKNTKSKKRYSLCDLTLESRQKNKAVILEQWGRSSQHQKTILLSAKAMSPRNKQGGGGES